MLTAGTEINQIDIYNNTALHYATINGIKKY